MTWFGTWYWYVIFHLCNSKPSKYFNVAFWLIWRRDTTGDNVKSPLKQHYVFQSNVKTTLFISTLMWTTLNNVETTLSFSTSSFTTLFNVETTLWRWPFPKKNKKIISNWTHWIQSFNCCFIIFFTLLPIFKRDMLKNTCKATKIKIMRTWFKPLHFVKY